MPYYKIRGTFRMGRAKAQQFEKQVKAASKEAAIEHMQSHLGSRHFVAREQITFTVVEEIRKEDVSDPTLG